MSNYKEIRIMAVCIWTSTEAAINVMGDFYTAKDFAKSLPGASFDKLTKSWKVNMDVQGMIDAANAAGVDITLELTAQNEIRTNKERNTITTLKEAGYAGAELNKAVSIIRAGKATVQQLLDYKTAK